MTVPPELMVTPAVPSRSMKLVGAVADAPTFMPEMVSVKVMAPPFSARSPSAVELNVTVSAEALASKRRALAEAICQTGLASDWALPISRVPPVARSVPAPVMAPRTAPVPVMVPALATPPWVPSSVPPPMVMTVPEAMAMPPPPLSAWTVPPLTVMPLVLFRLTVPAWNSAVPENVSVPALKMAAPAMLIVPPECARAPPLCVNVFSTILPAETFAVSPVIWNRPLTTLAKLICVPMLISPLLAPAVIVAPDSVNAPALFSRDIAEVEPDRLIWPPLRVALLKLRNSRKPVRLIVPADMISAALASLEIFSVSVLEMFSVAPELLIFTVSGVPGRAAKVATPALRNKAVSVFVGVPEFAVQSAGLAQVPVAPLTQVKVLATMSAPALGRVSGSTA